MQIPTYLAKIGALDILLSRTSKDSRFSGDWELEIVQGLTQNMTFIAV